MDIAKVGEDVLQQPARRVEEIEFDSTELHSFVNSLLCTMLDANGVGIAAPQVFDSRMIAYIASKPNARYPDAPTMEPLLIINPQVIAESKIMIKDWEGCLSVPGLRGCIQRPSWVEFSYQDISGCCLQKRLEGFAARIFWHEYDHLIGKTWLDRVESEDNKISDEQWREKFAITS